MALVYKRPNSPYWYVIKTRQSTGTANKKFAEEFALQALNANWRKTKLNEKVHTFTELAADWLDMKSGKASLVQDEMVIGRVKELLERRKIDSLGDVTGDVIAAYARSVKEASSPSTANRHLTTIRAMLRRAEAKGWIQKAPNIEAYDVEETEAAYLEAAQCAAVVEHLPEWVADMYVFAQQTGLRFSNVAEFRWSWLVQGDAVALVPSKNTKTKRIYTVPLSDVAKAIVAKLRALAKDPVYVFVGKKRVGRQFFKGKRERAEGVFVDCAPVASVRYWWEQAADKAGFPGVTWHQATRHTWASHHTQNDTPDRVLAKMGGWASTRMLDRYAHLKTEHLVKYANNLNGNPLTLVDD